MKAPIVQAGEEAACPPGYASFFFLGPRNRKIHYKKLGFRLGSDLVMLCTRYREYFLSKQEQLCLTVTRWFQKVKS
jgi:hypothetical protein